MLIELEGIMNTQMVDGDISKRGERRIARLQDMVVLMTRRK